MIPKAKGKGLRLLVTPDTVLRWHRDIVRRRWAASAKRGRSGRPATRRNIKALVVRLAKENPEWGYRRIHGEMAGLGVNVAASTVWEILNANGIDPDQRALPFPELARASAIYAYSFILTNLDVSAPDKAAAVEHWHRHRTTVENIFRDSKLGAALRHLPSGYPQVNLAWMWGALLAACMAAWLHQLTARTAGEDILAGHGIRGGKAMIATLRWRLIAVPGRLVRHARHLTLRLPPGHGLLPEVLARLRNLPALT